MLTPVCGNGGGREGGVSIDADRWVVVERRGVAQWRRRRRRDKLISETPLTPDYDLTECAAARAPPMPMDAADTDRSIARRPREDII